MGLAQRTEYRLRFLKSERWNDLRVISLAKYDAKCYVCRHRDLHNDVHHVWYGRVSNKNAHNVLRVLCRRCHKAIHVEMKRYPKPDKQNGAHDLFAVCAMKVAHDIGIADTCCGGIVKVKKHTIKALDKLRFSDKVSPSSG